MKKVVFDKEKYLAPSWNEMGELCFELAQKILKGGQGFDRLVAIAKGGLTWSRTLLDYLSIPKISSFQMEFYKGIGEIEEKPLIIQSLPVPVEKEEVLIFDDVADSGETLKIAKEYLKMCGAKNVSSATLFIKAWVKTKPDFYAKKTDAWIIFPHEIRETIGLLSSKWRKKGISRREIKSHLSKIGLPEKEIKVFMNLSL